MKKILSLIVFILLLAVVAINAQQINTISSRCVAPNQSVDGFVRVLGTGDIVYTPCPTRTSIFTGNVDLSGATVIGGAGGATTQVQYNNAGALAGSANFTWDNTNTRLVIGSGTADNTGRLRFGTAPSFSNTFISVNEPNITTTGTTSGVRIVLTELSNRTLIGGQFTPSAASTSGTTLSVTGISATAGNVGIGGTVATSTGGSFAVSQSAAATTTLAYGVRSIIQNTAGTMTDARGLSLDGWTDTGTVTTSYGIYADTSIDIGATSYFIRSLSASPSLITGNWNIGDRTVTSFVSEMTPSNGAGTFLTGDCVATPTNCLSLDEATNTIDLSGTTARLGDLHGNGNSTLFTINDSARIFNFGSAGNLGVVNFGSVLNFNYQRTVTAAGTTGAQIINMPLGSINFAAAAASVVVTNSIANATSLIFLTPQTADATCTSFAAVRGVGSFTITANAACTAETAVAFHVTN